MSVNPISKPTPDSAADIPEAIRNTSPDVKPKPTATLIYRAGAVTTATPWPILGLLGLGGGVILLAVWVGFWHGQRTTPATDPALSSTSVKPSTEKPSAKPEQKFGHFQYPIAPESELELVIPGQTITLRKAAAVAFRNLIAAAAKDGVNITLISGFRDLASQEVLFYDVMKERGQTPQERAEVSAPPGFSEHHTGYAVDIGDVQAPATNLSPSFEETAAFAWMQKHAAEHQWELSFPLKNRQGVNYEPWHWRYVGNRQSLTTFSTARSLASSPQTQPR